ncbi:uncharacterized protein [Bos indicus]|uniref:Uncharacterized protein n=1 Tax=Bos indicus TaxID=9915 RepID=A0ABM4RLZ4_BOSIN
MLRQGAGARGSRLPATAARCLRRPLPAARGENGRELGTLRGSHKQLPPKPGKWLDDWSLLLALRWKGGDSLKCVRGRRAPGNPEAWIRAESGTESPPLPRQCLLRPPGRPASRRRRPAPPAHSLPRRRSGFFSSSFASSSSFAFSPPPPLPPSPPPVLPPPLSPPPPPRPPPPLHHHHSLRGTPVSAEPPVGAVSSVAPWIPQPAEPGLGGTDGRADTTDSSRPALRAAALRSPASGELESPREPSRDQKTRYPENLMELENKPG